MRHEAGLGARVRELAILTTARELNRQFEWAAHEPEAIRECISLEIIEVIKHRRDSSGLSWGVRSSVRGEMTSDTFVRALQQFGRRALVDLVALMGNYAGTPALQTAFDMQLDPGQPPPLPPL